MKVIKFENNGLEKVNSTITHIGGAYSDYTLCGISLDETEEDIGNWHLEEGKITCEECIKIIKLCKKIKL
jgi:hypothetical protein